MKLRHRVFIAGLAFALTAVAARATDYFVSPTGGNIPPFTSWATAATNIQDAIDAAAAGDVVWVTNGVYAAGGRTVSNDPTTNRVVVDKPLTVQSVNGSAVTVIMGAWDPVSTNGIASIRCAWLTNGAVISGFALQAGSTRVGYSGGGLYAASDAQIANCLILSNAASSSGGGAYQGVLTSCYLAGNRAGSQGGGAANGTLLNCFLTGNFAKSFGGGAVSCTLRNCALTLNSVNQSGGGAYSGMLVNCTLAQNLAGVPGTGGGNGGGAYSATLTNCIVFGNRLLNNAPTSTTTNYSSSTLSFCCAAPLSSGTGNIASDPQLLADGVHIAETSPCRGAGTAGVVAGNDIDGQAWGSPPPIGCDAWSPSPLIAAPPQPQPVGAPVALQFVGLSFTGQQPMSFYWSKDGSPLIDGGHYSATTTASLLINSFGPADAGAYQVVVSNAFGMATSAVVQVVVHCVSQAGASPQPPYVDWLTAATNIQDAIDVAAAGEFVLVTNGVYASGGKTMDGDLTNRVTLDKVLTVQSVNGLGATIIQGAWDPASTNGPAAVRCAWLTNGATLNGFTLTCGATRAAGTGGGVYGSTNGTLANCLIISNSAGVVGGGAYQVTLVKCSIVGNAAGTQGGGVASCTLTNCIITQNSAVSGSSGAGGGALNSTLRNCAVTGNFSGLSGGGTYGGALYNCTLSLNQAGYPSSPLSAGGGAYSGKLTNCIVFGNRIGSPVGFSQTNYSTASLGYCCATPLASGPGNIAADPQLLADGIHIAATSPCRAAGTNSVVSGTDIDGQIWNNAPPIGCDEWTPAPLIVASPHAQCSVYPPALEFVGLSFTGQQPIGFSWTKDGSLLSDGDRHGATTTPGLTVAGLGLADAGTYRVVVSNAFGVATSTSRVVLHCVAPVAAASQPPFPDWATAATNLQDAVDAAAAGEFVLVTNGTYASGGKVMAGDLTNRMALDKPLTVISVNGPAVTVINGVRGWDLDSYAGAVRCAWLTNGTVLAGFTLQNGGTRLSGVAVNSGGGIWAASTNALVLNCILVSNRAWQYGGGTYQGVLRNCHILGNDCNAYGGGAAYAGLVNCTVNENQAVWGGGMYYGFARNSIIYDNTFSPGSQDWYYSGFTPDIAYSCTSLLPPGIGNLATDPRLFDGTHLALNSPCRGSASITYSSGIDLDGEPWGSPPSMGCDEVWESAIKGPLTITQLRLYAPFGMSAGATVVLSASYSGRANRVDWSFGNGQSATNASTGLLHIWDNPGIYDLSFTAFNLDYPSGVSSNIVVAVGPFNPPLLSSGGMANNMFSLSLTGLFGVSYTFEKATNLAPPVQWQPLSTFTGTGGVVPIIDPNATNGGGFYRVRFQSP